MGFGDIGLTIIKFKKGVARHNKRKGKAFHFEIDNETENEK